MIHQTDKIIEIPFSQFSPDGYLFDKEAILEYILHQKREIARKQKEYEKQIKRDQVCVVSFSDL